MSFVPRIASSPDARSMCLEGAATSAPVELGNRRSIQPAPTERRPPGIRLIVIAALLALAPVAMRADVAAPAALRDVAIEEHLGARLPLDATLTTSDGRSVA